MTWPFARSTTPASRAEHAHSHRPAAAFGVLLLHVLVAAALLRPVLVRIQGRPEVLTFINLSPLPVRLGVVRHPQRARAPRTLRRATAQTAVAIAAPLPASKSAPTPSAPVRSLDLHVPDRFIENLPGPNDPGWVFDDRLARALDEAKRKRHARELLADRRRAREGVSAEDYRRPTSNGERVKTDAGCFELQTDSFNGRPRWYREPCADTRTFHRDIATALPQSCLSGY